MYEYWEEIGELIGSNLELALRGWYSKYTKKLSANIDEDLLATIHLEDKTVNFDPTGEEVIWGDIIDELEASCPELCKELRCGDPQFKPKLRFPPELPFKESESGSLFVQIREDFILDLAEVVGIELRTFNNNTNITNDTICLELIILAGRHEYVDLRYNYEVIQGLKSLNNHPHIDWDSFMVPLEFLVKLYKYDTNE